eukprot:4018230-Heterocapsa_arctica.AAC.1
MILIQEHKIIEGPSLDEASQWAKDNGWTSIWTPALQGVGMGKSSGTAILARPYLGLRLHEIIGMNPSQAARLTMA